MRRIASVWAMTLLFLASTTAVAIAADASTSKVFVVSPSGGDDTANIQDAFDSAVMAGPGSTVELTAGTFYCNNIVVEDFHGRFKGAGKGATVIDTLRGLDQNQPGLSKIGDDMRLSFFCFNGGNLNISDMTFDVTAYEPADEWMCPAVFPGEPLYNVGFILRIMGDASSQVERVEFIGHEGTLVEDEGRLANVEWAMGIHGLCTLGENFQGTIEPLYGSHVVSECYFEHVDGGIVLYYLVDGQVTFSRNIFTDTPFPIAMDDLTNSVGTIAFNEITANIVAVPLTTMYCAQGNIAALAGSWDPYLGPLPANAEYLVHHNIIHASGLFDAISLMDLGYLLMGAEKSLKANVWGNQIYLDVGPYWGGIFGLGVQDAVVVNNLISGQGLAGVYMGVLGDPCAGWTIAGNRFLGLNAEVAHVWLGSGTSDCVVAAKKGTTVLDEGSNNIVTGAKN